MFRKISILTENTAESLYSICEHFQFQRFQNLFQVEFHAISFVARSNSFFFSLTAEPLFFFLVSTRY